MAIACGWESTGLESRVANPTDAAGVRGRTVPSTVNEASFSLLARSRKEGDATSRHFFGFLPFPKLELGVRDEVMPTSSSELLAAPVEPCSS